MVSFGEKGTCREIKKIRLYTEMDKIAEYFRFLIFFSSFLFPFFFFRIHRWIRSEEEQSGIIINRSKGNNIVPFLEKIFEQCMLRRDNIFHLAIEKSNTRKKKEKRGIESPGDTDGPCATAKLRNSFSIRSRPRREKRILCYIPSMKFTDRDPIDPSFVHFFYILSNSSPPLLFLAFFFETDLKRSEKRRR